MSQAGISSAAMEPLRVTLAKGWTKTAPRRLDYGLVYLWQGRLLGQGTDFTGARAVDGEPGDGVRREARVPLSVDRGNGVVYWIRHEGEAASLTATDPRSRESRLVASAEGFSDVLAYDPKDRSVLSFIERGGKPSLVFVGARGAARHVRVEGEGLHPSDVHATGRRVLFGHEGPQITLHGFDGRVVADTLSPADPEMMSFHPSGESAAIAHAGLSVWDFASGKTRRVAETGRNVEWSPDGRALWFTERDSELWTLDLDSGRAERVLKLEGDSEGCTNFTNRLRWTPDGKHLLAQMSRKAAVSAEEEARRRKAEPHGWETGQSFDFDHYFCVLEPARRRLWLAPGYSHQVAWAEGL